jgi:hypothetical protein
VRRWRCDASIKTRGGRIWGDENESDEIKVGRCGTESLGSVNLRDTIELCRRKSWVARGETGLAIGDFWARAEGSV